MQQDQLRQALGELNGERDAHFRFSYCNEGLHISNALLIPEEPDHVIKLTDGQKVYMVDAEQVLWLEIG